MTPTPRLILIAIAQHGGAWGVRISQIMRRTHLAEATIQGHLRGLMQAGYVEIVPGTEGRNKGGLRRYRATRAGMALWRAEQ